MKTDVFILVLFLFLTTSLAAKPSFIDDVKAKVYTEKYMHIAVAEMDRTGIPASIKMAQAILESGVGESKLAVNANNHFGIKCGGDVWTGETYYMWDDETVESCFRVYESAEESFVAHSEFLLNPKKDFRYGFLFKLDRRDYKAWAKGLQSAGYATAKTYSKNLIAIIERLELYKLDYLTAQTLALNDGELAKIFPTLAPEPDLNKEDTSSLAVRIPDPFSNVLSDSIDVVLTMFIFQVNGLDVVYVQADDDLDKIAMRYRKKSKQLARFNDLKNRNIKVGQYIYLQKKNNYYKNPDAEKDTKVHIVRQGQQMYDIAQLYGIKLKKLYALNKAYRQIQPKPGVQIFLRKD